MEDTTVRLQNHLLERYNNDQQSLFANKIPFCSTEPIGHVNVEFDVTLEVIDGDLPFILDLPSLIALGATWNHKYITLAVSLNGQHHHLQLENNNDHLYLPFNANAILLKMGMNTATVKVLQRLLGSTAVYQFHAMMSVKQEATNLCIIFLRHPVPRLANCQ